jgi:hypothetical protein
MDQNNRPNELIKITNELAEQVLKDTKTFVDNIKGQPTLINDIKASHVFALKHCPEFFRDDIEGLPDDIKRHIKQLVDKYTVAEDLSAESGKNKNVISFPTLPCLVKHIRIKNHAWNGLLFTLDEIREKFGSTTYDFEISIYRIGEPETEEYYKNIGTPSEDLAFKVSRPITIDAEIISPIALTAKTTEQLRPPPPSIGNIGQEYNTDENGLSAALSNFSEDAPDNTVYRIVLRPKKSRKYKE